LSESEGLSHQHATISGLRYPYVRERGKPEVVNQVIAEFIAS